MKSYVERAKLPGPRRPDFFQPASDAQKMIFLRNLKEGKNVGEARKKAGISPEQFRRAQESDPDFSREIEDTERLFLDRVEMRAETLAMSGDGAMIRWFLEKRMPEKYGKTSKVEVSHRFHSADDIKKLSDEDLQVAFEELGLDD